MPSEQETVQALARAVMKLYATMSGLPAPDALRARLGADDALLVLQGAGLPTAEYAARWNAEAAPQPEQRQQADMFESDPMHSPAVVAAQVRGDAAGVKAALREVAEDTSHPLRAQKAALAIDLLTAGRAQYSETSVVMVTSPADACEHAAALIAAGRYKRQGSQQVPLGVSADEDGRPIQRSAVHTSATPV